MSTRNNPPREPAKAPKQQNPPPASGTAEAIKRFESRYSSTLERLAKR